MAKKILAGMGSCQALGTALILAWLFLAPSHALLMSPVIHDNAVSMGVVLLVLCALWSTVASMIPKRTAGMLRWAVLVSGIASAACSALLVFSHEAITTMLALALSAFFALPLVFFWLRSLRRAPLKSVMAVGGLSLVVGALLHLICRLVTPVVGASGNTDLFLTVGYVLIGLLPLASALAALGSASDGAAVDGRVPSPDARRMPALGLASVCLVSLLMCLAAQLFGGFTLLPYFFDIVPALDGSCAIFTLLGVLLLLAPLAGRISDSTLVMTGASVMFGVFLAVLLSFAVVGLGAASLGTSLVRSVCALSAAFSFAMVAHVTDRVVSSKRVANLLFFALTAVVLCSQFAGTGLKQLVGVDSQTLVVAVLAVVVALLLAFFVAMVALSISGQRRASRLAQEVERRDTLIAEQREALERDPMEVAREKYRAALEGFGLSPRELEVAVLIVEGKTNKTIAEEAGISESTVRFHSKNAYTKANVSGKKELRELVDEKMRAGD